MIRLSIRVDLVPHARISPGNIALLEEIERLGSISAAGRSLSISYRHAWLLVDELNGLLAQPVVTTHTGGSRGGGASLTPLGQDLVRRFRLLEHEAIALMIKHLGPLEPVLARPTPDA